MTNTSLNTDYSIAAEPDDVFDLMFMNIKVMIIIIIIHKLIINHLDSRIFVTQRWRTFLKWIRSGRDLNISNCWLHQIPKIPSHPHLHFLPFLHVYSPSHSFLSLYSLLLSLFILHQHYHHQSHFPAGTVLPHKTLSPVVTINRSLKQVNMVVSAWNKPF